MLLSSERDTTEVGDQWFFVLAAINRDFEAFHSPVGGMHRGAVGVQHGAPACFMLIRQGADERLLHEPVQSAAVRDVGGQQVVLHLGKFMQSLTLSPRQTRKVLPNEPHCHAAGRRAGRDLPLLNSDTSRERPGCNRGALFVLRPVSPTA